MSKHQGRRSPAHRSGQSAHGSYEVGYGRPPKKSQFTSGTSGNPKGRPKSAKNEATILRNIFNRQIEIRDGGRVRKVSVLEGMLLRFTDDAVKGNPKSAAFLLNRYRLAEGDEPATNEVNQDDRDVLESFIRRLEADLKAKKE